MHLQNRKTNVFKVQAALNVYAAPNSTNDVFNNIRTSVEEPSSMSNLDKVVEIEDGGLIKVTLFDTILPATQFKDSNFEKKSNPRKGKRRQFQMTYRCKSQKHKETLRQVIQKTQYLESPVDLKQIFVGKCEGLPITCLLDTKFFRKHLNTHEQSNEYAEAVVESFYQESYQLREKLPNSSKLKEHFDFISKTPEIKVLGISNVKAIFTTSEGMFKLTQPLEISKIETSLIQLESGAEPPVKLQGKNFTKAPFYNPRLLGELRNNDPKKLADLPRRLVKFSEQIKAEMRSQLTSSRDREEVEYSKTSQYLTGLNYLEQLSDEPIRTFQDLLQATDKMLSLVRKELGFSTSNTISSPGSTSISTSNSEELFNLFSTPGNAILSATLFWKDSNGNEIEGSSYNYTLSLESRKTLFWEPKAVNENKIPFIIYCYEENLFLREYIIIPVMYLAQCLDSFYLEKIRYLKSKSVVSERLQIEIFAGRSWSFDEYASEPFSKTENILVYYEPGIVGEQSSRYGACDGALIFTVTFSQQHIRNTAAANIRIPATIINNSDLFANFRKQLNDLSNCFQTNYYLNNPRLGPYGPAVSLEACFARGTIYQVPLNIECKRFTRYS